MTEGILKLPALSLLLGCFGFALLLSIRQGEGLVQAFEKLALGYLVIIFHGEALALLSALGKSMEAYLASLGSTKDLDAFIAGTLADAATKNTGGGISGSVANLLTYTAQVVRTGVWGVLASCTELLFLLARFVLEVGRDALWQITVVLFPLAAAVLPIAPKVLLGMAMFALELVLWLPVLKIINIACSEVARRYMQIPEDIGFYVLALELVAVALTFAVPMITHKFITGSLQGSTLETWKQTFQRAQGLAVGIPRLITGQAGNFGKRLSCFAFIGISAALLGPEQANAKALSPLQLSVGILKKIDCKGKLYVSGVGDESIVRAEALPSELGCAVILRPQKPGRTNLILETSAESYLRGLIVTKMPGLSPAKPTARADQSQKEKK